MGSAVLGGLVAVEAEKARVATMAPRLNSTSRLPFVEMPRTPTAPASRLRRRCPAPRARQRLRSVRPARCVPSEAASRARLRRSPDMAVPGPPGPVRSGEVPRVLRRVAARTSARARRRTPRRSAAPCAARAHLPRECEGPRASPRPAWISSRSARKLSTTCSCGAGWKRMCSVWPGGRLDGGCLGFRIPGQPGGGFLGPRGLVGPVASKGLERFGPDRLAARLRRMDLGGCRHAVAADDDLTRALEDDASQRRRWGSVRTT